MVRLRIWRAGVARLSEEFAPTPCEERCDPCNADPVAQFETRRQQSVAAGLGPTEQPPRQLRDTLWVPKTRSRRFGVGWEGCVPVRGLFDARLVGAKAWGWGRPVFGREASIDDVQHWWSWVVFRRRCGIR